MNITGNREENVFYIDDDKVMIYGKMYYAKAPQNLAEPNVQSVLSEVRALKQYEFIEGYGLEVDTTDEYKEGNLVRIDDVIKLISEHFR